MQPIPGYVEVIATWGDKHKLDLSPEQIEESRQLLLAVDDEFTLSIRKIAGELNKTLEQQTAFRSTAGSTFNVSQSTKVLKLSVRAHNCLYQDKIYTVGDLIRFSPHELRKIPNLGPGTLKEIVSALKKRGLYLSGEAPPLTK